MVACVLPAQLRYRGCGARAFSKRHRIPARGWLGGLAHHTQLARGADRELNHSATRIVSVCRAQVQRHNRMLAALQQMPALHTVYLAAAVRPDDEPAMHSADDRNMHVTERAMGGVADVASARASVSLHCFGLINGCTITHSLAICT